MRRDRSTSAYKVGTAECEVDGLQVFTASAVHRRRVYSPAYKGPKRKVSVLDSQRYLALLTVVRDGLRPDGVLPPKGRSNPEGSVVSAIVVVWPLCNVASNVLMVVPRRRRA